MSGAVVKLLDRRRFEYSYLPGSGTQSMVLVPLIESCGFGYLALYARVHERSMAAGQSLSFSLYNILPSDEDAREFVETDVAGSPVSFLNLIVNTAQPPGAPGFWWTSARSVGPYVKLVVKASQPSVPATFFAEISLLLHLRET